MIHKAKIALLAVGDVITLYLTLALIVALRYPATFGKQLGDHLTSFTITFVLWIAVFYIAGLYDLRYLRNNLVFFKTLALALSVNAVLAVLFFYLVPISGIAPKTNLFLFLTVFIAAELLWRRLFNRFATSTEPSAKIILVGKGETAKEIFEFVKQNKQLGYEIVSWIDDEALPAILEEAYLANLIVVPHHLKKDSRMAKTFYNLLIHGVEIQDIPLFYENLFRKVPLRETNEEWFLEHITQPRRFYDSLKRGGEAIGAFLLSILLLPLLVAIALLVKLTSRGPAIYKQVRVGEGEREFMLYKFRTMKVDAEKNGPKWAESHDARTTLIGIFLRASHLDELPQLLNIVKGDISFVGPRPERPEFIKVLKEKVSFYEVRHLVKPGITGWAQINYRYGASVEDAEEKLRYDIYYLKNRSMVLDVAIILKTIKSFFVNQK